MTLTKRPYNGMDDFYRVRDFLSQAYITWQRPRNWMIERWNFARYRVTQAAGIPISEWEKGIGVWEYDSGRIAAVVHSEAEGQGEVFFQLDPDLTDPPWDEFFDHAERNLRRRRLDEQWVKLWIPAEDSSWEQVALTRGYEKDTSPCHTSELDLQTADLAPRSLPEGFELGDMDGVRDRRPRAKAVLLSFHHPEDASNDEEGERYRQFQMAPDYRASLDVYVKAPSGAIAAGCVVWFDPAASTAVLEPVGTVPDHRRRGFASAAMVEALRRARDLGAHRAYVGSDQPVYQSLGFKPAHPAHIWTKRWS